MADPFGISGSPERARYRAKVAQVINRSQARGKARYNDTLSSFLAAEYVDVRPLFAAIINGLLEDFDVVHAATMQEIYDAHHRWYLGYKLIDPVLANRYKLDRNGLTPRPVDLIKMGLIREIGYDHPPICDPATGLPTGRRHAQSNILELVPPQQWSRKTMNRLNPPLFGGGLASIMAESADQLKALRQQQEEAEAKYRRNRTDLARKNHQQSIDYRENGKGWEAKMSLSEADIQDLLDILDDDAMVNTVLAKLATLKQQIDTLSGINISSLKGAVNDLLIDFYQHQFWDA